MREAAGTSARWLVVAGALIVAATASGWLRLPSPYLLGAFAVGIAYALGSRTPLTMPAPAATLAQGVVGVTAGSYLDRSTVAAVAPQLVPILIVSALTVALSIAAGLVLARFSQLDNVTAAFGMIAGGAAGIISLSRELGADERLVAVLQYVRVVIIVAVTPVVAVGVFGMHGRTQSATSGVPFWSDGSVLYVACAVILGLILARLVRLPGGAVLGPMVAAAAISLLHHAYVTGTPVVVADLAFAVIGLDVGLRFTSATLREAGEVLLRSIVLISVMLVISAGFGIALARATHVNMLDGYLATTPGGLTAIVALAVGGRTDTTFIVSVQVIRTFLMLAATPVIAGWLASRRPQRRRATL